MSSNEATNREPEIRSAAAVALNTGLLWERWDSADSQFDNRYSVIGKVIGRFRSDVKGELGWTNNEQAAQVWTILAFAANNRQTLTYCLVGKLLKRHPNAELRRMLECIQSYGLLKSLPALTSLGLPGAGFMAAQSGSRSIQQQVFNHDWLTEHTPTAGELLQAVIDLPSCGRPEALRELAGMRKDEHVDPANR